MYQKALEIDQMKEGISKLKGRNIEMIQVEEQREVRFYKSEEMFKNYLTALEKPHTHTNTHTHTHTHTHTVTMENPQL